MMEKIKLWFQLFYQGREVANAAAVKNGQITAAKITALLGIAVALAKVYGYEVPFSDHELASLGVVLYALLNWVLTVVTSSKVGLPAPAKPEPVPEPAPVVQPESEADSGNQPAGPDTTYIG
jgi:hypothetical protein